jgi:glucose-1-phosphate cytidylyltransferase
LKVVILAGGLGTRFNEETKDKPKPMMEIGRKPILWHIMKNYSNYGINDFIICTGYKQDVIQNYFLSEFKLKETPIKNSTFTQVKVLQDDTDQWKITMVDTGLETMTGGRLKRIKDFVGDETFCFTYGDTLNDLNLTNLINFHKELGTLVTVTACQPPGKFGILEIKDSKVIQFEEKPKGDGNWVNGGYFVLEPLIFDYIKDDSIIWEHQPLQNLVKNNQVSAFKHFGFYQPMDTIHEKKLLEKMWDSGNAKWKQWN